VTPQYIQQWKDKGYQLDADDMLNKKIRGRDGSSKKSNDDYNYNGLGSNTPPRPTPMPRPMPTPTPTPNVNVKVKLGPLGRLNSDEDDNNISLKGRDMSSNDITWKAVTAAFNLLKKDGLIQEGKDIYNIKLTAENWTINGKSLDANTVKNYNAAVEKVIGRKLNQQDKLTFKGKINRIGSDDVSVNGSLHVDFED
jgi:hypothetical protein